MNSSQARRGAALIGLAGGLLLAACNDVPEVRYRTEHFEVAPDFEHPICQGTLTYFEEHLEFVEAALARSVPFGQRIRFYWITEDLDNWCSQRALGCYYPGTRVIFGSGESVSHEIVHAVLNAEAQTNYFLEEAIAELYSGVGAYRRSNSDSATPGELLWLSPEDYRFGAVDYAVAGHFMAYVEAAYGPAATRAVAAVVVTAAGPPDLERAFERFTNVSFDRLEQDYESAARSYYRGLHEQDVPDITDSRWIDVSLHCDEDHTFGPLPDASPGMYRRLRVAFDEPYAVDVELLAPERVTATIVDVGRERARGRVVDFNHPLLSGEVEHEVVRGGERRTLNLRAGTHLMIIEQRGYETTDAYLQVVRREFPRESEPAE